MTTKKVFLPVLIETAEQAEALPIGTVTIDLPRGGGIPEPCVKNAAGRWAGPYDSGRPYISASMVGDYALVPVEAEKHTERHWCSFKCPGPHNVTRTVYRTPWEPA